MGADPPAPCVGCLVFIHTKPLCGCVVACLAWPGGSEGLCCPHKPQAGEPPGVPGSPGLSPSTPGSQKTWGNSSAAEAIWKLLGVQAGDNESLLVIYVMPGFKLGVVRVPPEAGAISSPIAQTGKLRLGYRISHKCRAGTRTQVFLTPEPHASCILVLLRWSVNVYLPFHRGCQPR